MNALKKTLALLLVLVMAVSCLPLGAVTAFAAELDETQAPADETQPPTVSEEPTEDTTEPVTELTEEPTTEESTPAEEPVDETVPETTPPKEVPTEEATEPTEPTEQTTPDRGPPMMAANPETKGGSSGSEVGGGGDGGGNAAGSGSSNMIAVGVTMQIVYYRYDDCYNRYNSHGSVVSTVKNGKAIPWNSTGKDKGETMTTVFDTYTITDNTFIVKAR